MRCVLCDGLEKVAPEEADTVIIAGMGGENMAQILQNAPWTAAGALLRLQPMTHPEILSAALHRMGIRITEEHLVQDSGRIYPVISANSGADEEYLPGELYIGRYKLVSGEALFPAALESWRRKTDEVIAGLERSRKPDDLPRLNHMRAVRRDLEEMRRMYDADRS
jgi:tRNA (adenine22-N1)-methyltransferase